MTKINEARNTFNKAVITALKAAIQDNKAYSLYTKDTEDCSFESVEFTLTEKGNPSDCVIGQYYYDNRGEMTLMWAK